MMCNAAEINAYIATNVRIMNACTLLSGYFIKFHITVTENTFLLSYPVFEFRDIHLAASWALLLRLRFPPGKSIAI